MAQLIQLVTKYINGNLYHTSFFCLYLSKKIVEFMYLLQITFNLNKKKQSYFLLLQIMVTNQLNFQFVYVCYDNYSFSLSNIKVSGQIRQSREFIYYYVMYFHSCKSKNSYLPQLLCNNICCRYLPLQNQKVLDRVASDVNFNKENVVYLYQVVSIKILICENDDHERIIDFSFNGISWYRGPHRLIIV